MNQKKKEEDLLVYVLRLADNAMIIGQRLSEWCGHGPVLEQDMAMTNLALDHIGQARSLYQYAAEIDGKGKNEDNYAFLRDVRQYSNVLITEQPNGDFAHTIVRQFIYDVYNIENYRELTMSNDAVLAGIAGRSFKEVKYHLRFSSEWMKRLGDGTEESHSRMQKALDDLWGFHAELYEADDVDIRLMERQIAVDLSKIAPICMRYMKEVIEEATLTIPTDSFQRSGGRKGLHTEHLGFILADLQFMQRAYPGQQW